MLSILVAYFLFSNLNVFAQSDQDLKQKIETINKEMAQAMVDGKLDANLRYYTSDAISMPNYSQMVEGVDAIKKSTESMLSSGAKIKRFETKIKQVKSSGNQVIEIGTYDMSMLIPGMSEDFKDQGKYLTVWEKQPDGSLKIKVEIWNTDTNPMGGGM